MTMTTSVSPSFQIGEYKITVLSVGQLALDGGAMFGVVPKVLWEKLMCPDEFNRIPLSLNCLLVEYRDEKLLLDTGVGTKFSQKYLDMYGIRETHPMAEILNPLGLETDDITRLCLTHLHFDHAGGATQCDECGEPLPVFENAEVMIHRGEWHDAFHPSAKSRASYLKENFTPLEGSGKLTLLEGPDNEILPGLTLRVTGGHTEHHQALVLDTAVGGFIYWGDLIPTHHHLKIPYVMAYDLYPVESMRMKDKLLKESWEKGWYNIFEHDLDVAACRLDYNQDKHVYAARTDSVLVPCLN